MLGPFVLRRLKLEVASQLTGKQQKVEMVSMTDSQAELYQSAVQELKTQVAASDKGVLSARSPAQLSHRLAQALRSPWYCSPARSVETIANSVPEPGS